jgi:hypothetical protein
MSELPDFSEWTHYRIQSMHRLHAEGEASLNPSERELYQQWVAGLQQELDRRANGLRILNGPSPSAD